MLPLPPKQQLCFSKTIFKGYWHYIEDYGGGLCWFLNVSDFFDGGVEGMVF